MTRGRVLTVIKRCAEVRYILLRILESCAIWTLIKSYKTRSNYRYANMAHPVIKLNFIVRYGTIMTLATTIYFKTLVCIFVHAVVLLGLFI